MMGGGGASPYALPEHARARHFLASLLTAERETRERDCGDGLKLRERRWQGGQVPAPSASYAQHTVHHPHYCAMIDSKTKK